MIKALLFLLYNLGISLYYFVILIFYLLASFTLIFSKKNYSKIAKIFPHFFFKQQVILLKKRIAIHSANNSAKDALKIDFWLHAVSAGELKLAAALIKILQDNGKKFLITYTSQTAKILSKKLFPNPFTDSENAPLVLLQETPVDFLPTLYGFIKKIQPKQFICIEHDVWPNMLWLLKKMNCSRTIVNFALKPKDYFYYRQFPFLFKWIYDFDLFLLQNKNQAHFLKKIALLKPFHYVGNLKFPALTLTNSEIKPVKLKRNPKTQIVVLGSSHAGEEKIILAAFNKIVEQLSKSKKLILVIIPRHLARLKTIVKEVQNKNLTYTIIQTATEINPQFSVHIVNSMGESLDFYRLADLILIGDTFLPSQGGHNFIEALPYSAAVGYGEYQCNYADLTPELEQSQACLRIKKEELPQKILFYLEHLPERQKINRAGREAFAKLCYDVQKLKEILGVQPLQ